MVRFFPISYHSYEDRRGVCLVFFAYNNGGEKIAIRFRYTHWFYASLEKHLYSDVQGFLSNLSTVSVESHDPQRIITDTNMRDAVNNAIQYRRSTVDQHSLLKVVKICTNSNLAKQEAIRILTNHNVNIHESDNNLTPLLKMMAEKDIRRYQWMSVDVQMSAQHVTKFRTEYIGDVSTIMACTEEIPPPEFSIFSFDGEMDSTNWNKMPDAKSDPHNSIRMLGVTYKAKDTYKEYLIVFGPDITDVYEKYRKEDIRGNENTGLQPCVTIYTCTTEIECISKIFHLIEQLDPDVITGHNIIAFDNQYILDRYKLLVMQGMSDKDYTGPKSVRIPNISRLINHSVSIRNVEWNNSQVAVNGIYFDAPGRIWIDTMVVSARGLLGNLKNNKLETLGTEILGMGKNNMHHKTMFKGFDLHTKWQQVKRAENNALLATRIPFKKKDVQDRIRDTYEHVLQTYNQRLPRQTSTPKVNHINELILLLNIMNQRGKKFKVFSSKDITSKTQECNAKNSCSAPITESQFLKEQYLIYRERCKDAIQAWNIPVVPSGEISDDEMIQVIWYIIGLYCLQDTRIPYQVIEQQGLIPMLQAQSSTFSVDIADVLMRGQVYTTTASQYRYNYQRDFMMDFGNKGGPIEPFEYEGGYVGKGTPGLKIKDDDSIIFVIDFASLYPTIIIAHNVCYTTWVNNDMREPYIYDTLINIDYIWRRYENIIPRRLTELYNIVRCSDKLDATLIENEVQQRKQFYEKQVDIDIMKRKPYNGNSYCADIDRSLMYIAELECILSASYEMKGKYMCSIFEVPNTHTKRLHVHWFLRPCILPGVVPVMLWEQYLTRKIIKGKMSAAFKRGDIAMGITYNAQQDGTKRSMNATYGGFGTRNNRLANFAAAEVITWVGRECIHECNHVVDKQGLGDVVYNDTDSAMIRRDNVTQLFNRDTKKIKEYGNMVANKLSLLFPAPMSLECENFFVAYFLKGPKMYAAIKWDEKTIDISNYTWEYVSAMGLLYIKGMVPVRRDKYTYSKELFMKVLYYSLVRSTIDSIVQLLEYAITEMWKLRDGLSKGNRTDDQWVKYLANVERLFAYNMGVTSKAIQGGDGTMARWCNIYAQKYGRKPAAGERFELLVTNVGSGIDKDKHTRSPAKLVSMEWLLEENRQLDIEHYILQLENDGNVLEIMHISYPEEVPRRCISGYYLKKFKRDGCLEDVPPPVYSYKH